MPEISVNGTRIIVTQNQLDYILRVGKEIKVEPCSCDDFDTCRPHDIVLTLGKDTKTPTSVVPISKIQFSKNCIYLKTETSRLIYNPKMHTILCERCYGKKQLM